tara:strand:+ start:52 stop:1170 length:1119 start_codon:yes stop_codon:yes gene_type:complete
VGILDFFSREAGQQRRAALDEFGRDVGYYVPPELRSRLGLLASMNPVEGVSRSMQASERMTAPGRTPMQRVGDAGEMLSEVAGVVAPVAVAGRAGIPAAQALQETLLGFSAPRSASEAMARDVLDLRAAGRAGEVTEEMMAAADPQYMFANTPLPMDVASRNARADELFPRPGFHGTNADIDGFRGNVFSSDNPTLAGTYARGITDAQVYPLRLGSTQGDEVINARGRSWGHLPDYLVYTDAPSIYDDIDFGATRSLPGRAATDDIAQAANTAGRSGVQFNNIYDIGPGFSDRPFANVGYSAEQAGALHRQYIQELSAPSNIDVRLDPSLVRSRFARFDPAFKHLRNLSAGFGGLGLLGLASGSQPAQGDGT